MTKKEAADYLREQCKIFERTMAPEMKEALELSIAELDPWRLSEDPPEILEGVGSSEYVLVAFSNAMVPEIGRYEEDEDGGGSYYLGDDEDPCIAKYGLVVKEWRPLPQPEA